ncbi:MAG: hypothetical protein WC483_03595 [Candidatus Paceibacterota bacterium]
MATATILSFDRISPRRSYKCVPSEGGDDEEVMTTRRGVWRGVWREEVDVDVDVDEERW